MSFRPATHVNDPRYEPRPLGSHEATARYIDGSDLTPALAQAVVSLLRRATNETGWPAQPNATGYLEWFLRDYPGGAELCAMERRGELIGMTIESRVPFRLDGRRIVARGGGNLAIAPEWQGKGLNSRFFEYRSAYHHPDIDVPFTEPSHPAVLQRVLTGKGPDVPFGAPVDLFLRPLDVREMARVSRTPRHRSTASSRTAEDLRGQSRGRFVPRPAWLREALWRARILRSRLRRPPYRRPAATWSIEPVEVVDAALEAFLEHARSAFSFIREWTREQFEWRYLDPRGGSFSVNVARAGSRVVGYVVVGIDDDGQAAIADLFAPPGELDVVRTLLDQAIEVSRQDGAPAITAYVTRSHPHRRAYLERGFIQRPFDGLFAYVPPDDDEDPFLRLRDPQLASHFVMGDTNHV